MAGTTGLEPATSDVTGRRSNQLNYVPANRGQVGLCQDSTGVRVKHYRGGLRAAGKVQLLIKCNG